MSRQRRKKLPAGLFPAQIETLSHDGRGIAHQEGKTLFVDRALPDEKVEFEYTFTKSQFDEGKTINVIEASPLRVEPHCPHFSTCGGCSLQHLSHEGQLEHKQQTLLNQLQHFGHLQPRTVLPPIQADTWEYRTKARLGVRWVHKKDSVLVGFREKYSHYITNMSCCPVLDKRVGNKITDLRVMIAELSCFDQIAQIEMATTKESVVLILRHLKPFTEKDHSILLAFGEKHGITFYLQPGNLESIHILPGQIAAPLHYTLKKYNITIFFEPTDFTQINLGINEKMVDLAIDLLAPQKNETILDLFCGLGNFTLPLARQCLRIIGVEGSQVMVERAQTNAKHNDITNTEFHCFDLTKNVNEQTWAQYPIDKVLIDPPRSGALEMMPHIVALAPKCIVYVSCNPATLARDSEFLVSAGYTLEKAGILDMFPHTSHVESIALFVR